MDDDREIRIATEPIEVRNGADGKPRIVGYASVFNTRSAGLPFVEIVRPGAFSRSLKAGDDVIAMFDHAALLGRRSAGTLIVEEDDRGLRYEIVPADTQAGRDAVENIRVHNVIGSSFAFRTKSDRWDYGANPPVRELLDVDLLDVSPCLNPAYPRTDVAVRSLAKAREEADEAAKDDAAKAEQERQQAEQQTQAEAELEADGRERDLRLSEIA